MNANDHVIVVLTSTYAAHLEFSDFQKISLSFSPNLRHFTVMIDKKLSSMTVGKLNSVLPSLAGLPSLLWGVEPESICIKVVCFRHCSVDLSLFLASIY